MCNSILGQNIAKINICNLFNFSRFDQYGTQRIWVYRLQNKCKRIAFNVSLYFLAFYLNAQYVQRINRTVQNVVLWIMCTAYPNLNQCLLTHAHKTTCLYVGCKNKYIFSVLTIIIFVSFITLCHSNQVEFCQQCTHSSFQHSISPPLDNCEGQRIESFIKIQLPQIQKYFSSSSFKFFLRKHLALSIFVILLCNVSEGRHKMKKKKKNL